MFILIFCAACALLVDAYSMTNVVTIKNGQVQGRYLQTEGKNLTYSAFLGIPFAEPPVGELRFEPPVPKKNWEGVFNATKNGNSCVQGVPVQGSEDCLFINVFVPNVTQLGKTLLPVMVWIYGGGFEQGSSNLSEYSPDYLIEKEVIVVTFNYRLGIFGFISTGDLVAPGNGGLKDQVLALKWVRDNIKQFGGNPGKVTIFGESAGAASVSYHLQSPQSRGLFHRAIIESGTSICPWALSRHVKEFVKRMCQQLSIPTNNSQVMINRLKKIPYSGLQVNYQINVAIEYLIFNDPRSGLAIGPVIEVSHNNSFYDKKSHEALTKGEFSKVPCIIGFNSFEVNINLGTLTPLFNLLVFLKYDLDNNKLVPVDLNARKSEINVAASKIKHYYFGFLPISQAGAAVFKFISDDEFVRPTREYVNLTYSHMPVYFYRFSYEGKLSGVVNRPNPGVAHAEELNYLWKSSHPGTEQDKIIRDKMTTFWTNFAKTGNPTPPSSDISKEIIWKKSDEKFTYLDIGVNLKLNQFPERKAMEFWDDIYDTYGNPPYDTY